MYERVRFGTIEGTVKVERIDTFVVVESGLTVEGKTNVSKLIDYQGQPYFIAYEASGDISLNHGNHTQWLTLPIATKTQKQLTIQEPGGLRIYSATHIGSATLQVTGENLRCQKVRVEHSFNGETHRPYYYFFSRKIGFWVKRETPEVTIQEDPRLSDEGAGEWMRHYRLY